MRRWIVWAGVAVALLVIGFALTRIPPAPPYEFLRGKALLRNQEVGPASGGRHVRVYSFRADYSELLQHARREAMAKGLVHRGSAFGTTGFKSERFVAPSSSGGYPEAVCLYKDAESVGPVVEFVFTESFLYPMLSREPGWVTVVVESDHAPNWFENFRAWLGF